MCTVESFFRRKGVFFAQITVYAERCRLASRIDAITHTCTIVPLLVCMSCSRAVLTTYNRPECCGVYLDACFRSTYYITDAVKREAQFSPFVSPSYCPHRNTLLVAHYFQVAIIGSRSTCFCDGRRSTVVVRARSATCRHD